MGVMGTLLAADPTGTFFRFTKILQIVNKLYFININYGKRLEAFLAKSAENYKQKSSNKIDGKEQSFYYSRSSGKPELYQVSLDFVAAMSDKVILYLLSWIF